MSAPCASGLATSYKDISRLMVKKPTLFSGCVACHSSRCLKDLYPVSAIELDGAASRPVPDRFLGMAPWVGSVPSILV